MNIKKVTAQPQHQPITHPSLTDWKRLYELADQIKKLSPWDWMEESDIFGVRHPETNELSFISVMGGAGEHFAVALYLGAEGLDGFLALEAGATEDNPFLLLEIPQLQLSFEDRTEIEKYELDVIKKLGLKYRGANAWPKFISIHPGFLPWRISDVEARRLIVALEQVLDVAPRVQQNPDLLLPADEELANVNDNHDDNHDDDHNNKEDEGRELAMAPDDAFPQHKETEPAWTTEFFDNFAGDDDDDDDDRDDSEDDDDTLGDYLIRTPQAQPDGSWRWQDEIIEVAAPPPVNYDIELDQESFDAIAKSAHRALTLEVAFVPLPTPVAEPNQRPFLSRMLLLADQNSGMILGMELLPPLPSLHASWEQVPTSLLTQLRNLEFKPQQIHVEDDLLEHLLAPLCEQLNITLEYVDELPAIHTALEGMMGMLGNDF